MSRVGKQIITVPAGVTVDFSETEVKVTGPKGTLTKAIRNEIAFKTEDGKITAEPRRNDKLSRSLWGTYMSHIKNMISGVQTDFVRKLLVEGVGFKWEVTGDKLKLNVGFSHPILMDIPKGLTVVAAKSELTISGIDKEAVTLFAMQIRKNKKPEPYKGKGIRYSDEVVRRKEGKKSA